MSKLIKPGLVLLLAALVLVLSACGGGRKMSDLEQMQYAYSAAIRWGDFEGAWNLVDPDYREAHPMSDLEFKRFEQIRISAYRELAARTFPDGTAAREIEVGVINRHNMAERTLRYTEQWRWDDQAGQWWVSGGLPDLWSGQ